MIPQPETPICWAHCLGGCSSDKSREHILTESTITGPEIFIQGFPFLQGKTITIHKRQFKSNILCRYHNNNLSQVDQAGTSAFDSFKDATTESPRRKNKIDGRLLERWLLKTLINIEVVCDFNIRVPRDLVEIAFGQRRFINKTGLYYFGKEPKEPQTLEGEDRISYMRLENPEKAKEIYAAVFTMAGFRLLLALGNIDQSKPLSLVAKDGQVEQVKLVHHPSRFQFQSHFIAFSWRSK